MRILRMHICKKQKIEYYYYNRFTVLLDIVWDYPGKPVGLLES